MAQEGMGGTILLGLAGIGLGAFIVDYAFSETGQSWYDQIAHKLKGGGPEMPPRLPPGLPSAPLVSSPSLPLTQVPPMPLVSPEVIREVQARLNSLGFPSLAGVKLPLKVDGLLGSNTQKVLAAMQRQWQLPVTSYPDPNTLRTLRSMTTGRASALPPSPPPPPAPHPIAASHAAAPIVVASDLAARLGQFFQLAIPASSLPPNDLAQLLSRFQQQMGLPATGLTDPQTISVLRKATGGSAGIAFRVGISGWESETSSLGPAAQDVIRHVIAAEADARTLTSLGQTLSAAGFPMAAAAVKAKAGRTAIAAGWW